MHQASRFVIKHALSLDCCTIVVGMNNDWKREVNLGNRKNQSFVHIPYQTFIHQLRYKAEQYGIRVIVTEESYTSKCSFVDMEEIKKQKQCQTRIVSIREWNADPRRCEWGVQHHEKRIPKGICQWDRGCGVAPHQNTCRINGMD